MDQVVQQQLYSHYRMWYNNRHKNELPDCSKVTCNSCRNKFEKNIMIIRKYGEHQKIFYYCRTCFEKLKNSR